MSMAKTLYFVLNLENKLSIIVVSKLKLPTFLFLL